VHDALLVEGPADDMDRVIAATRLAMEQASEMVLGKGRIVKTDVELVTYPDRYADEGGVEMWDKTKALLEARGW
jgi:hypothetical protein